MFNDFYKSRGGRSQSMYFKAFDLVDATEVSFLFAPESHLTYMSVYEKSYAKIPLAIGK